MISDIQTGQPNGDLVRGLPIEVLSTSANGWPLRPFQIVSLYEVLEFWGLAFYTIVNNLRNYTIEIERAIERRGKLEDRTSTESAHFRECLDRIRATCERYELNGTYNRVMPLLDYPPSDISLYRTHRELEEIDRALGKDLAKTTLMYVPAENAKYLDGCSKSNADTMFDDSEQPMGKRVSYRFPEARKEIVVALTCYAVEAYTACVFHLMRAVEIGARVMISRSGLSAGRHLPCAIELCTWKQLIETLNKGLDDLRPGTSTDPKKRDKLEYYTQLVGIFMHFKDPWRNKVSHLRKVYKPGETKDAIDNTRQFLSLLAQRAKEPKRIR